MTWAIDQKGYSPRRACKLVGLQPKTYRSASTRPDDDAVRTHIRELASQRRRFGYRRLGLLLARQGVRINRKKLYRLYKEERLRCASAVANGRWVQGHRCRCRRVRTCAGRSTSSWTRSPAAAVFGRHSRDTAGTHCGCRGRERRNRGAEYRGSHNGARLVEGNVSRSRRTPFDEAVNNFRVDQTIVVEFLDEAQPVTESPANRP